MAMKRYHGVFSADRVIGFCEVEELPALLMMGMAVDYRHRYAVYFVCELLPEDVERVEFLISRNWHFKAICALKSRACGMTVAEQHEEFLNLVPDPSLPDFLPPVT